MKMYVLGTGAAGVTECYNTCFTLSKDKNDYFLVDGGGGNGILSQLKKLSIPIMNIHNIFVSHNHIDHILGVVWVMRRIVDSIRFDMPYDGNLNIYCSDETASAVQTIAALVLNPKQKKAIEERVVINTVKNGDKVDILGNEVEFFDMCSPKDKQFGFKMLLDGDKSLVFAGDEPLNEKTHKYVENAYFFLCEAFCSYGEREKVRPYEKGHNTVKESSEIAEKLGVKNLVLWHTVDKNLPARKKNYTNEAKQYFKGNVFVPDDLDIIDL